MEIGEENSVSGNRIDIRRSPTLLAVTSQVTIAKIIGEDQNDVRWLIGCMDTAPCSDQRKDQGNGEPTTRGCIAHVLVALKI
jgi:hypothetical protein